MVMPMPTVYIVIKAFPIGKIPGTNADLEFCVNEAVFSTEVKANDYIAMRKKIKDRDDRGCSFRVEPWCVQ